MDHDVRCGTIWRAFVWVSWCLLGLACSEHSVPLGQSVREKAPTESAAPASADWSREVQTRMAHGARAIRADGTNSFRVSNRQQGLSGRFDAAGALHVEARSSVSGAPAVQMQLTNVGREGMAQPVGVTNVALGACASENVVDEMGACLKRLEVQRGSVVEWWESREEGLEQGFVFEHRPEGRGLLELYIAVEGAQVEVSGDHGSSATLRVDERTAWSYAGLAAMDARGKALESWIERDDVGGIRIVVDDDEAIYPVVVDPVLSPTAVWTAEGNQIDAQFGFSVASAGDVNGDGFGDVIVGAPFYDNEQVDEGCAFVYLGNATGLSSIAVWMAESNQANAQFGYSVAAAGDVNGDGFGDVIVGAPYYDNAQSDNGRAFVYLGNATGLGTNAAWVMESSQTSAHFGTSVASAGDVNGDGYSDVIVGAPNLDNGQTDEGRAFVYLGGPVGLGMIAAWSTESDQSGAFFGDSVASAGDINGDGYGDVIVGAPLYDNGQMDEGRAFVYLGSPVGLGQTAAWTAESDQASANFGGSVTTAGDVNGDGYGDVIIGASSYDNGQMDEGRAFVYLGSPGGLGQTATWTAESDQTDAHFGHSVATAGDINGDGFGDVIVGAVVANFGQIDEGRTYVYLGSAAGLENAAAATKESNQHYAYFGQSVASAGDVNGDGFADIIVGAEYYDSGEHDEGRASLFLGSAYGLPNPASPLTVESDKANANLGWSVASAGDVNGDGYGDVIVGARWYAAGQGYEGRAYVYHGGANGLGTVADWAVSPTEYGAQYGWSVASAGDVNGDGFGDVIVGAPYHDRNSNNMTQEEEGAAYVYLGGPMGLATTADWSAESDQPGALFGFSVAGAGDVNGDGFGDVIIGAPFFSGDNMSEQGCAHVYLGSANGLLDPMTNPPWVVKGDQNYAHLGQPVANAGDINGDGFGDVLIGAYTYDDNERLDVGRVYVYLGSANGLPDPMVQPTWIAPTDQEYAHFGDSVASAGDVNGDGFGDVVVGASGYDNVEVDTGRLYVYHGSAEGIGQTAAVIVESTREQAYFGASIASAGDVNGDGFGDVIVGAPGYGNGQADEGRVYVYVGSPTGLVTSAAWSTTSNQANNRFGWSVAGAGDINGDGFGDVILGAPSFDNGQTDEGRAFIYMTSGAGRPHLRLFDPVTNHPVGPWNALTGSTLRVTALGATPFGRLNVKPEVELKPLGVPFNGLGTTLPLSWAPGFSSGTFQDLVTQVPLVHAKPHHLRWRLRYHPAEGQPAVASRWAYAAPSGDPRGVHFRFGVCGNGVLEGDEPCDDGNVVTGDGCSAACKRENGSSCAGASVCATGFCVDGVCCDNACDGLCQACSAMLKGNGVDGECGYFAEGTDPNDECMVAPQDTCQQDGFCDGNGACRLWAAETSCGSNACAGNIAKRATCDGLGTCQLELMGTDCGANGCDPATGQCITGCADDTDCTADAYCDSSAGQCKPKAQLGTACTAPGQCQSGHCIDTVCCNEACDGLCQACSEAAGGSTDGFCGNVAAGTTDDACAQDPDPCGFTGVCTDIGTCALAAADIVCAPPTCNNGTAHTSSCNGQGACEPISTSCGDYACNTMQTACNTQCTTNQDCIAVAYCDKGQCKPDTSQGTVCTSDELCLKGHCLETGAGSKVCCESDCASDACLPNRCSAAGLCISTTLDCSPYQCADATLCKTSCSSDTDCQSGYECRGHECGVTTCDDTKKCLENETCDATTHKCMTTNAAVSGCSCQLPGSRPEKQWPFASIALALLLLRRARLRTTSSRRAS